jgi:hypothetical protein
MKCLPMLMFVVLSVALVPSGRAQSTASPKNESQSIHTKQGPKTAKGKPSAAKPTVKAQTRKPTTASTQDSAYAAAYKAGIPK